MEASTLDELIGTAEQEYQERKREQAIRSAPQKRPCIPGDIVYLENDKAFIVQDIGEGEILLQDQELPLFSRSVSKEEFSRLLERNERNSRLQAPATPSIETSEKTKESTPPEQVQPQPIPQKTAVEIPINGKWTKFQTVADAEQAAYEEYKANIARNAQNYKALPDEQTEPGGPTVRNATIQQRCGLSENTIRSAVAGLEQKGLLVVSARQDREGRRISNQYKLLQLSGAWGKLPVEAFNLDKRDFAVYAYLCRCSNGQRKAFPSFSHMATVLHMAIGTVQTAIKSLMAAGRLLKAAFRAGKHNLYILVETVAQALPGANPGAQKENRRAGTRRQKIEMLLASIASLISNSKILHEIGACQEVLLVFLKRVCQNLRNSNKTNPTYSTKERYFSLSKLAIGGEVRLSELPEPAAEVGVHGKVPFIQAEGFRVCSAFRAHGLPDRCARLFFSLYCHYSRCHQRR